MIEPKKMWRLVGFAFLFMLALNVSCKHKNENQDQKPTPVPNQKFRVSFSVRPFNMAKITASAEGINPVITTVQDHIDVEAGKTVKFTISDINEDYIIQEWKNVTKFSEDKMSASLEVTKNVNVTVKLGDRPAPMVKVTYSIVNEFDQDNIHQGLLGVIDKTAGDVTVLSGGEVPVGHYLHISANPNNFNGIHRIKSWNFINPPMSISNIQEDVFLTVDKSHIKDGINFTVEFEKGEPPEPPLPDGMVRVKCGVYLWDNLEELNFTEGAGIYCSVSTVDGGNEFEGGVNIKVAKDSTVKYRLEPRAGKVVYKWVQLDGAVVDSSDIKKVTLTADADKHLKAVMKNEGMSIFSVFVKDENDAFVDQGVASVLAKVDNSGVLQECKVSKKYVEAPTGKDVILELMPKDPSYQIASITVTPTGTQTENDTENPNKFKLKNVNDDIVVTIKMKKVDTVDVTINGDEHVQAESKKTFKVSKGTLWKVLKETQNIKGVAFTEGYMLDKWLEDSASGTDLVDTYAFQDNKTIFVKSTIQMKKIDYSVKDNKEQSVDSSKVSITATREDTSANVPTGSSVPYGTKISFVATIQNTNWVIKRWSWNVQEDPSTKDTDHTKASITLKENDEVVTLTAEEVIKLTIKGDEHVKEESKKEITIAKGSTWRDLRYDEKIRAIKFSDGYKLAKYLNGDSASSPELKDDDVFDTAKTIFVTSKDANLMKFTYKVKDKDWKDMDSSKYSVVAKKEGTSDIIANGSDVPKGTKIAIEITFTQANLKVRYWTPDSAKDNDNPNKGLVTIGDGDMEVIMAASETVNVTIAGDEHIKAESKKTFSAWKGTQWWSIRDAQNGYEFFANLIKFEEGYELDKYLKDSASGAELQYDTMIDEDITVYVKSKKKA